MPRHGSELVNLPVPPRKKMKLVEEPAPSLDASYFDDEALLPGIVFNDILQKKWKIGKPIGRGSFGRIYLASDNMDAEVTKATARYVVKIEPHTNGPLFVEVHCMIRTAQATKVQSWRQRNKLKRLGMPIFIASGSFTDNNTGVKYRFLVLPRYDIDLQKIITRTKVLDLKNVCVLAIQILQVLEYLHSQGYTHSDIKSSNLMLGFDRGNIRPTALKAPSYQKETKEVTVLVGKHRKAKSAKSRPSNYYDDEDFVANGSGDDSDEEEGDRKLATVKRKLRKMLTDRDHRNLNRHHAFNLRQLSHYVNYEDLSSSVCSDQSYQKLIEGNKKLIRTEEFNQDVKKSGTKTANEFEVEIRQQAVLSQSSGQIYLLDYGLASKFVDSEGNHKDFVMDARKAHDGTLEYSSRDSHIGAHSRRSDLETLGYNLIDWLTGSLPWKSMEVLAEPDLVHAVKKKYMSDLKLFLKTCFSTEFYPKFLEKYFEYVTSLDFKDTPDYDYCRSLFKSELLKNGYDKDILLNFADPPKSPMSRAMFCSKRFGKKNAAPDFLVWHSSGIKKAERENVRTLENDLKLELLKETLNTSSDGVRKPCTTRNFFVSDADLVARLKKSLMPLEMFEKKLSPKNLRSQKNHLKKRRGVRKHRNSIGKFGNFMGSARQFTWAEILAGNPEDIIRKERNNGTETAADDEDATCKYKIRRHSDASACSDNNLQSPLLQKDFLLNMNPTYAMKDVVGAFKKKISRKSVKDFEDNIDGLEGYTPAMIKVCKMKERREQKDRLETGRQQNQKEFYSAPCSTRARRKQNERKPDVTCKNMRNKTVSITSYESTDDEEETTPTFPEKRLRKRHKTSETSDCDTHSEHSSEKTTKPKALVIKKRKILSERSNRAPKTVEFESPKLEDTRVTRSSRLRPTGSTRSKALVKTTNRKQRSPECVRQSEHIVINNRRCLRSSKRNK